MSRYVGNCASYFPAEYADKKKKLLVITTYYIVLTAY